jgi:thioredoxin-like negative regulator of GroEL
MTELTADTFDPFVQSHPAAVVHFWAIWNCYDRTMRQVMQLLEEKYGTKVAFGTLDVEPEPHYALCAEHGVVGPPFFAYYRNGRRIGTEVGVLTVTEMAERLDRLLQSEGQRLWR